MNRNAHLIPTVDMKGLLEILVVNTIRFHLPPTGSVLNSSNAKQTYVLLFLSVNTHGVHAPIFLHATHHLEARAPCQALVLVRVCPSGTYSTATQRIFCSSCLPGKYATAPGASSSKVCLSCAAGTYSSCSGANLSHSAIACRLPARYLFKPGRCHQFLRVRDLLGPALFPPLCFACAACSYTTADAASSCAACHTGTYGASPEASSPEACTACGAGAFSSVHAASACEQCPAGKYTGLTSTTACAACTRGTYSTAQGLTAASLCALCAPGLYSTALGATDPSACIPCAAGKASSEAGGAAPPALLAPSPPPLPTALAPQRARRARPGTSRQAAAPLPAYLATPPRPCARRASGPTAGRFLQSAGASRALTPTSRQTRASWRAAMTAIVPGRATSGSSAPSSTAVARNASLAPTRRRRARRTFRQGNRQTQTLASGPARPATPLTAAEGLATHALPGHARSGRFVRDAAGGRWERA